MWNWRIHSQRAPGSYSVVLEMGTATWDLWTIAGSTSKWHTLCSGVGCRLAFIWSSKDVIGWRERLQGTILTWVYALFSVFIKKFSEVQLLVQLVLLNNVQVKSPNVHTEAANLTILTPSTSKTNGLTKHRLLTHKVSLSIYIQPIHSNMRCSKP